MKDKFNGYYKDIEDTLLKEGKYQTEWVAGPVDFLEFFLKHVRMDKTKDFRFTWNKTDWGGIATITTFKRKYKR